MRLQQRAPMFCEPSSTPDVARAQPVGLRTCTWPMRSSRPSAPPSVPKAGRAFASGAWARLCVLLGALLATLGSGCGGTPDNFSILVLIENVPTDATQLVVKASLDGSAASNQLDVANSLTRFGVRVPSGKMGSLVLNMQVLDSAKCVVAEGDLTRALAAPEYQLTLNTRLNVVQPRRCPVEMVPTCSPKLFCWSGPQPQGNPIRGIWATSASDVWAVGDFGALLHYNGSAWQAMDSTTTEHLRGVWASSAQDVIVVGENGKILRSTGGAFSPMTSNTTQALYGVWGNSAADEVWAVGAGGVILKLDRATSTWGAVASPTTSQLNASWGSAKNRVYAAANGGTVLRYNGTAWAIEMNTGATGIDLLGIGGDASKVVAVGTGGKIITSTTPNTWMDAPSGTTNTLFAVFGKSGTYWVAGAGGVRLRDVGAGYAMVTGDAETASFYSIGGSDAADVWAGGDGGLLTNYKTTPIAAWTPKPQNPRQTVRAIYGFNSKDVWAVGAAGQILHYDGTTWTQVPSGTIQDLNGIWGATSNDLWAVGNNRTVLRYDGKQWAGRGLGDAVMTDLHAVWGSSSANVWISGASSNPMENHLVHFVGAAESALVLTSGTGTLPAFTTIWGMSPDSFWVGGGSIAANVLPAGPQIAVRNLSGSVVQLWGSRENDIWAVGNGGNIAHYNGVNWQPSSQGATDNLKSVFGYSDRDVWAVGENGTVLRWNGTDWARQTSLTRNHLRAVWGPSETDTWAGGELGTLLHTLK